MLNVKTAKLCIIVCALTVSFSFAKTGVFNAQRLVDAIEEGKSAKKDMEASISKLKAKEQDLGKLQQEFDGMRVSASKDALQKKSLELQKRYKEYQDLRMSVEKQELSYRAEIGKKIKAVVDKVAKRDGYTMVLEEMESGVHFHATNLGLTDMLIKEYNKMYKVSKPKKK